MGYQKGVGRVQNLDLRGACRKVYKGRHQNVDCLPNINGEMKSRKMQ
jgi:hypothetical protein